MNISIREMIIEDLDEVLNIEKRTFPTPWSKSSFEMEIKENLLATYIVAEVDDQIAGYAGMWTIIDEGHITNIAVDEDYKGQSLGNFLLVALIKHCVSNNIFKITLEVRRSNSVAINLYKKYGFVEKGIRKNYYAEEKEDAIVMWKKIERPEVF